MSTTVTGVSGATYITGTGSSGFNSSSLIESAVAAKMAPANLIDDQIEVLNTKIASWETMKSDVQAISTAAKALSSQTDDSVFDDRSAYLKSSDVSNLADVMAVSVTGDADLGVYDVEIQNLATTHKVASDEVADITVALGYEGVFSVTEDNGAITEITVTADMSLDDLAKEINSSSGDSGVTATLLRSSDDGYTLVLASADTGNSLSVASVSGDDVLMGLGVTDAGGAFANELQQATLANLTIDGVPVTSASNNVENILPGVSISLYDDSAGSTITLEVGQDLDGLANAITGLVDAYNEYRAFALVNQQTDEDGAADDAILFSEGLLRTVNSALYSMLSQSIDVDGQPYSLKDIGLSYDEDNFLVVDDDTLETMLIQNPDVVQAFFQQSSAVSNDDLYVADTSGSMAAGDYTVDVVVDVNGDITSATINGDPLDVDNMTLTGADGSAYEGLRLVYTGTSSNSITMQINAGMGDVLVTSLDGYTHDTTGLISTQIESLDGTISTKQDRRDRIAESADDYQAYLTTYYARIEAEIEASELALAQVEALFATDND